VLRRECDGVYVDHADPVVWFAQHALRMIRETEPVFGRGVGPVGWEFDGTHVILDATNGRWVWKLTGRSHSHHYGHGSTPLVMLEGVWPD